MSLLSRFLSRLAGDTSKRDTGTYTCPCGRPMENTAAYTRTDYRSEMWECTDKDCHEMAEAYLFENESYGTGPLRGQVTGESK